MTLKGLNVLFLNFLWKREFKEQDKYSAIAKDAIDGIGI